jgi:predicted SprT family Zn-dependent metalloprotease
VRVPVVRTLIVMTKRQCTLDEERFRVQSPMSSPATEQPPQSRRELLERAQKYTETVDLAVDVAAIEWEISERAKRQAGVCRYDRETEAVTISLTWAAYQEHGWAQFRETIRHELIHAWEYQQYGESSHGSRFKLKANELDVSVRCEGFTDPRLLLTCTDDDCEWELQRYRASKTVTQPERYSCGDCGSDYEVRHCESGRTWRTNDGYEQARAALGEQW